MYIRKTTRDQFSKAQWLGACEVLFGSRSASGFLASLFIEDGEGGIVRGNLARPPSDARMAVLAGVLSPLREGALLAALAFASPEESDRVRRYVESEAELSEAERADFAAAFELLATRPRNDWVKERTELFD